MSIYDDLINSGVKPLPEGMWFEFRETDDRCLRIVVLENYTPTAREDFSAWLRRILGGDTTKVVRSVDLNSWDLSDTYVARICRELSNRVHKEAERQSFIDKYKGKHGE